MGRTGYLHGVAARRARARDGPSDIPLSYFFQNSLRVQGASGVVAQLYVGL